VRAPFSKSQNGHHDPDIAGMDAADSWGNNVKHGYPRAKEIVCKIFRVI